VEFERTKEVVARLLPPPPASVADIGGRPGRYSIWLAKEGEARAAGLDPVDVVGVEGLGFATPRSRTNT
jgi:ubiquinone/menaquinone biosynthesis C-methylase UbiE